MLSLQYCEQATTLRLFQSCLIFQQNTHSSGSCCCQSMAVTPTEAAGPATPRRPRSEQIPLAPSHISVVTGMEASILVVSERTHFYVASCILLEVTKNKDLKGIVQFQCISFCKCSWILPTILCNEPGHIMISICCELNGDLSSYFQLLIPATCSYDLMCPMV